MFILPGVPSSGGDIAELADFAELLCWETNRVSAREMVAYLGRTDDNDRNIGCEDDDTENTAAMDEVMIEISRRSEACNASYPFKLKLSGTVLESGAVARNRKHLVYLYLLLATRLNMSSNKKHAGIDGALLLEELGAVALKHYLGAIRARSMVFGTAIGGNFQSRIASLCKALGEGGRFRASDPGQVHAVDDKLDAVAWVPFADRSPSQLIIFAQCKTGTSWKGHVSQLQPDVFISKWFDRPFLTVPLRAFIVAESCHRDRWNGLAAAAGVFLDRCRIAELCDKLDDDLAARIAKWVNAAKSSFKLIDSAKKKKKVKTKGRT